MNIVELKERVLFHLDRVQSPRWGNTRLSYGIQVATDDFIQDRYDNIKEAQKQYAFETVERIRAELRTIVQSAPLTPTNDELTLPTDYRYDVGLEVIIDGVTRNSRPVSISEALGSFANSHTRPNDLYPVHNEIGNLIRVRHGQFGVFSAATLHYIRQHLVPFLGEPIDSSTALSTNTQYIVTSGQIDYLGVQYNKGNTFTTNAVTTAFTGAGTVALFENVELPETAHEEIAKRTASILSGNVENYNKSGIKEKDVESN